MIYYKVPKIDNETIQEARDYEPKTKGIYDRIYKVMVDRHYYSTKRADNWGSRDKELKDLIHLYIYFRETKNDIPEYKPYLETMDNMFNKGNLILTKDSNYPMRQFVAMSIEPLAMEALRQSKFNHDSILSQSDDGKQDYGIDAVIKGNNIDVKTIYHDKPPSAGSLLGSIKSHALDDPTKETDYILWTGNCVENGYIVLKGAEKWNDVKNQVKSRMHWWAKAQSEFQRRGGDLVMYYKKHGDLNPKKIFDKEFIGDFSPELKESIERANSWTSREHSYRAEEREDIAELLNKVEELVKVEPKDITDKDVKEIDAVKQKLTEKFYGYIRRKDVYIAGVKLTKHQEAVKEHLKSGERGTSITKPPITKREAREIETER